MRKRMDKATWRKRGHARRFTQKSVQDDKYSPAADAIIHRHNLRKVRPFARNPQLDDITPPKYGMVSIERQEAELKYREVVIQTRDDAFTNKWHCRWLKGNPKSARSVRMMFYGDRAVLIRYDLGLFERSPEYSSVTMALRYFELYERGRRIGWRPVDEPLYAEAVKQIPPDSFSVATIPRKGNEKRYVAHKPLSTPKGRMERLMRGMQSLSPISDADNPAGALAKAVEEHNRLKFAEMVDKSVPEEED